MSLIPKEKSWGKRRHYGSRNQILILLFLPHRSLQRKFHEICDQTEPADPTVSLLSLTTPLCCKPDSVYATKATTKLFLQRSRENEDSFLASAKKRPD
ncbi:hypothetical protein TNCT_548221 [Trichonephila clavata]|uniref:Uncharacterized protein n=1 Tax=Trichonephila clavata TaxID=2740835 RepID=A0A8X6KCK2_TRICU|nr:hypothetical protein TNCT_548221 [Trichonephila clavata]